LSFLNKIVIKWSRFNNITTVVPKYSMFVYYAFDEFQSLSPIYL
jgi:hypothetical protein